MVLRTTLRVRQCRSLARLFCTSAVCKKYSIVFYGTDDFSLKTLRLLAYNATLPVGDNFKLVNKLHVITKVNGRTQTVEHTACF